MKVLISRVGAGRKSRRFIAWMPGMAELISGVSWAQQTPDYLHPAGRVYLRIWMGRWKKTMSASGWYGGSTSRFVIGFVFGLVALFAATTWGIFYKWYQGNFSEPGLGGFETPIFPTGAFENCEAPALCE